MSAKNNVLYKFFTFSKDKLIGKLNTATITFILYLYNVILILIIDLIDLFIFLVC